MLSSYIAASLVLLLTPGPTNTLLGAYGAAAGFRRASLLPIAEAMGYAVAIPVFHAAGAFLSEAPYAVTALKAAAGLWLLHSGVKLWSEPLVPLLSESSAAFRRVLVTTMLNPKAMVVATIVIPDLWAGEFSAALMLFLMLAMAAGLGWTALGAAMPPAFRGYSYKAASIVILGFSLAAMGSAFAG